MKQQVNSRNGKTQEADAGATLVFVAVVLVGLLALAAFAIDFGRMWEERRQLQNGADAAAVAIGEDCARGLCGPGYDEYAVAEIYVDANARDGAAWAWNVELDLEAQTVTVHNATEDTSGNNNFDMLFAGIVGFDGFTVGAKATVAWGGLTSATATIPIIISDCEFAKDYNDGGAGGVINGEGYLEGTQLFDEPGPNSKPHLNPPDWWKNGDWENEGEWDLNRNGLKDNPHPLPVVLTFHDGSTTDTCAGQSGQDTADPEDGTLSGGFGWLDTSGEAPCATIIFEGWAGDDPGASPSNGCSADELERLLYEGNNKEGVVYIPYFDAELGLNGANGEYHIPATGAFWVVGYNFGGQYVGYRPDGPLDSNPCRPGGVRPIGWTVGNNERCLVGYFVNSVITDGEIGPGGRGITVIKFIA
jgi:Flp pilus assembly protein TadG